MFNVVRDGARWAAQAREILIISSILSLLVLIFIENFEFENVFFQSTFIRTKLQCWALVLVKLIESAP